MLVQRDCTGTPYPHTSQAFRHIQLKDQLAGILFLFGGFCYLLLPVGNMTNYTVYVLYVYPNVYTIKGFLGTFSWHNSLLDFLYVRCSQLQQ